MTPWHELLRSAVLARYSRPRATPARDGLRVARGVGGCLMRLLMVCLFLFIALVAALFLFGRALL